MTINFLLDQKSFMFEKFKTCGPDGDYHDLITALRDIPENYGLALKKGIEYTYTEPIIINRSVAIQPAIEEPIKIIAPSFQFSAPSNAMVVANLIDFVGKVEITNGSTCSFDRCSFTCPEPGNAIMTVTDSTPNIRMCRFYDFPGYGVEYLNSKGGIITDCVFEKIGKDPINKVGEAKPYHQYNTVK